MMTIRTRVLTLGLAAVLIGGGMLLNRWLGGDAATPSLAEERDGPTLAAALAQPRPTLMEFGMDSCASCRAMQHQLERLRKTHPETLQVVSINLMEQRDLAEQWRIRAMPTQILLDADGSEVDRHLGFISADALLGRFADAGVDLGEPANAAR
ncbi:MAG: thioredoxin family protein [Halochromatium sp.]